MNNFYLPVEFEYDAKPLLELAEKYLIPDYHDCQDCIRDDTYNFQPGYHERIDDLGASHRTCMLRLHKLPEDVSDLTIITDLCRLFKNTEKHCNPDHVFQYLYFFNIAGVLPVHCDLRTVGFNIPLSGVDAPVTWHDHNGVEIARYTYQGPTLINTQINHGSLSNTGDRLFLSLGGFSEPFKDICEAISEN